MRWLSVLWGLPVTAGAFEPGEAFARRLDAEDPLRTLRDAFVIPEGPGGAPAAYFCGNSLGLQPRRAREVVEQELEDWGRYAVGGHYRARTPWYRYHETFRGPLSRLVGATEREVVVMNSLTANLHLFLVSFYRPTPQRFRILTEDPMFPSDLYAVTSQIRHHGFDSKDAHVQVGPREGETAVRTEDIEAVLDREGPSIALVLVGGVNFYSGQWFDIPRITRAAHAAGAMAGFDLAHAAGNVPLSLHDWDVDFAVWCSYKYLNGGPGAVGGGYVHERHAGNADLNRFAGWWGNDPETRFRLHLESTFIPVPRADGWQLSNPSILAMAPLRASLELFDRAGMDALREKSVRLTGYLEYLLRTAAADRVDIVTPSDPEARGCQLSLRVREGAHGVQRDLEARGIVCDFREPDILRVAPVPMYTTYHDVWTLASVLAG